MCSFCGKVSVYKLTPHLLLLLGVSGRSNVAARLNGAGRYEQGGYYTCMDHIEEVPAVGHKRRRCSSETLNVTGSDLLVCGAPLKTMKLEHDYLGGGRAPHREAEPANPNVWEAGFDCREETVPTFAYEALLTGAGATDVVADQGEGDEGEGDEGEGDSEDEGSEYVPSQSQDIITSSQDSQPPGLTPLRI